MKKALILGVTGQDGSYLAEILLEKGYEVHGMVRRSATGNMRNIQHLVDDPSIFNVRFFIQRGDLADSTSLYRIISKVAPDEIYNEADQDHVAWSYDMVDYSMDITGAAVGRLLEIIKQINPSIRFFQPCTSNMFGINEYESQNELTPFNPQSPYAVYFLAFSNCFFNISPAKFAIFIQPLLECMQIFNSIIFRKINTAICQMSRKYAIASAIYAIFFDFINLKTILFKKVD